VKRWQNLGLALTLLAVLVLVVSMVLGMRGPGAGPSTPSISGGDVAVPEPPGDAVRVEVLNASGRSGLARDVMRTLREQGFDVVSIGNAPAAIDPARSRVIDRVGRPDRARDVAEALGLDSVATLRDTTLYLEATVVIGRDWPAAAPAAP
jgi:hypothetical protein